MRIFKTLLIISIISLFNLHISFAQNTDELKKAVNNLIGESSMKHASLSVCVYDMQNKKEVYSYNSQQSMIPASLTKLFTTAAGFDQLGSDFRFKTTLCYSGNIDNDGTLHGDIYIIGGGDPVLGSYRYAQTVPDTLFSTWTKAVAAAGIKAVNGRVLYDATIFDNQPLHDNWLWGDVGNYFGCGVCGLNFHENMYFVYFNAGKKLGYPATVVRTVPKNIDIHGASEVTTAGENTGDNGGGNGQLIDDPDGD